MVVHLSRVGPLRTDLVGHYPDLAALRRSVKSGDWDRVSAYFMQLPVRSDQSVAVQLVAGTAGSERFLQRVVNAERDSSLARTLLGARFIVMAWKARGRAMAEHVSQAQWRIFFDYLQRAERVLADACAIDPTNSAAWTERVTVARGLDLDIDEGRRRYEKAAEHCDTPYTAQTQMVQNLCPKWGGSPDDLHAFARECLRASKPGSLGGAIMANVHVELAFARLIASNNTNEVEEYLWQRTVRDEVAASAAQTVLHPDFQPGHGWVSAHSAYAFALFYAGDARAAPHFAALDSRVSPYPWEQVHARWKGAFRRARRAARR